ncbi:Piezo non-specific cation channel cap domain-containing protein [Entamoeba marina]
MVVLVSTYVRDGFSGVAHTIMFKCLPQTYDLLRIEQDLILARQERDLVMEEDLNWEMIIVYRNPHLLFELTKKPPIHPPVKKYAFW